MTIGGYRPVGDVDRSNPPQGGSGFEGLKQPWTDADLFRLTRDTTWLCAPIAEDWFDIRPHLLTLYQCMKWINWPDPRTTMPLLPTGMFPPRCLEVGVRHGMSTLALLHAARETNGQVVSLECDETWAAHSTALIKAKGLAQWWELHVVNSNAFVPTFDRLDLLWLDGDHSAEQTQADLDHFLPYVRRGGLILFHDYFSKPWPCEPPVQPPFPSYVSIVVERLRATGRVEMITLPWSFGLTIARVL